ncbi:MAG: DUF3990 domain-containing protein [Treponema sp.]|nr:DUF3990 domain-containing protein [Treponema sp.]
MTLFHGSSVVVEKPILDYSRKSLDFGPGFYTTENREQAIDFARKVALRYEQGARSVCIYDYDIEAAKNILEILIFSGPDRLWLDYVHQNRHGRYKGKSYDLVIGPVANDDVYAALIVYEQGILNAEQTVEALKVKKLYSQYVFKTDRALSFLNFVDSFDPGVVS